MSFVDLMSNVETKLSSHSARAYIHVTADDIQAIRLLSASGMSSRKIAATLQIPRTTVQRYSVQRTLS